MQYKSRITFGTILISIFLFSVCSMNSFAITTQQRSNALSETQTITEPMSATHPNGTETFASIQTPPTTKVPEEAATPKVYNANLSAYESKENVTYLADRQVLQLDPPSDLNADDYLVSQVQSYSEINYTIENSGNTPVLSVSNGDYTNTWYEGNIFSDSYLREWFLAPKQHFQAYWLANFSLPDHWVLTGNMFLRLIFILPFANYSTDYSKYNESTHVNTGNVTVWNWYTMKWDPLATNLSGFYAGSWQPFFEPNGIYPLNYQHINPITNNVTVKVNGGTGENSTYVRAGVRINHAAIFLNLTDTYRCSNYTGYYQSEVIELPDEQAYYWDNFTLDVAGVSNTEGLDQQQLATNFAFVFGTAQVNSFLEVGQTFRPTENNYFKIEMLLQKQGNPLDAINVNLYEWNNLTHVGPSLASDSISGTLLSNIVPTYVNFTLRAHLNTSKQYGIVLTRSGPPDTANHYQAWAIITNAYPNGDAFSSFDGVIYNLEDAADMYFRTFYFVESYLDFEIRSSIDGITWDGWSSTRHQYTDFSRHTYVRYVQQNLTKFVQWRINFSSNHLAYLPTLYNLTFYYISYDWNYTVWEYDEFQFTGNAEIIYQISINFTLYLNITPFESWIQIFNLDLQQWDILSSTFVNGTWYLSGINLSIYFNGSLLIRFYAIGPWYFELIKDKQIIFFWEYYYYTETDTFIFDINPEAIDITFSLNQSVIKLLSWSLEVFDTNSSQWNTVLNNTLIGEMPIDWPITKYNGTIIIRPIISSATLLSIAKTITVVVYYPQPADIMTWLLPILIIGGIAAISVATFYLGYFRQRNTPETVATFN